MKTPEQNRFNGIPVAFEVDQALFEEMKGLAVTEDRSLADIFRIAVAKYVDMRRSSPDFPAQVQDAKIRHELRELGKAAL